LCNGKSELEIKPWQCNQLYKYFEAAGCLKVKFEDTERCRRLVQFDAREELEEVIYYRHKFGGKNALAVIHKLPPCSMNIFI
jgi:hypothetical protein